MNDKEQERLLISKREAAQALSVSIRTVENYIRAKELKSIRVGRRTLIPMDSLKSFAKRDHGSPRESFT